MSGSLAVALTAAGEFCGSLADPVLISDGMPSSGAALACSTYSPRMLEVAQKREHLVAVAAHSLRERRGGQAVAGRQ